MQADSSWCNFYETRHHHATRPNMTNDRLGVNEKGGVGEDRVRFWLIDWLPFSETWLWWQSGHPCKKTSKGLEKKIIVIIFVSFLPFAFCLFVFSLFFFCVSVNSASWVKTVWKERLQIYIRWVIDASKQANGCGSVPEPHTSFSYSFYPLSSARSNGTFLSLEKRLASYSSCD